MFLQFLIPVICAVCIIRTLSFAIVSFKEKNILGGISVILLAVLSVVSLIIVL